LEFIVAIHQRILIPCGGSLGIKLAIKVHHFCLVYKLKVHELPVYPVFNGIFKIGDRTRIRGSDHDLHVLSAEDELHKAVLVPYLPHPVRIDDPVNARRSVPGQDKIKKPAAGFHAVDYTETVTVIGGQPKTVTFFSLLNGPLDHPVLAIQPLEAQTQEQEQACDPPHFIPNR
jgi:hypothetical protein